MKKTFTSIVLVLSLCITQMFYGTEVQANTKFEKVALTKINKVESDKKIFEFVIKNSTQKKSGTTAIKRKRLFSVAKKISKLTSPKARQS